MKLELSSQTYGEEEIKEVMASMASGYVTMGDKVQMFEQQFAKYIGVNNAVMVNSGSSANLVMLKAIHQRTGSGYAFLPALSWSTTYWPVVQAGYTPVLVDCDPKTLNMCPEALAKSAQKFKGGKVVVLAHILGNPCPVKEIQRVCWKFGMEIVEDSCETLGSDYDGAKTGRFGMGASYSFYFSHHMSTIEGGMFVTPSRTMADHARMLRSHGWVKAMADVKTREALISKNKNIDPRFLFISEGYNLRPTELNAAMGIHQLRKLDGMNERRAEVYSSMLNRLTCYDHLVEFIEPNPLGNVYWFAFPVIAKHGLKKRLMEHLEANNIQTRPIIAGNLKMHPGIKEGGFRALATPGADQIAEDGLYWGCHPGVTDEQIEMLVKAFHEFSKGEMAA